MIVTNENIKIMAEKVLQSEELCLELVEKKSIEEAYEFCSSIHGGYSLEEFEELLEYVLAEDEKSISQLEDKDIENVSGGKRNRFFNKSMAGLLSALTATSASYPAFAVNAGKEPSVFERQVSSQKVQPKSFWQKYKSTILTLGGAGVVALEAIKLLGLGLNFPSEKEIQHWFNSGDAHDKRKALFFDTYRESLRRLPQDRLNSTMHYTAPFSMNQHSASQKKNVYIYKTDSLAALNGFMRDNPLLNNKKTAILNMANRYAPGGGVVHGTTAQEEDLCRYTTLYRHLIEKNDVYEHNLNQELQYVRIKDDQDLDFYPGKERGFYTRGVQQIRPSDGDPQLGKFYDGPIFDVISVAAPHFENLSESISKAYEDCVYKQLKFILDMAVKEDVKILELGALGCGAFGGDPEVVAEQYRKLLIDEGYADYFDAVIFPIFVSSSSKHAQARDQKNFDVFKNKLQHALLTVIE